MQTMLILTASGDRQAEQFRRQLQKRERLGLLCGVDEWQVVPDPQGRRVGSGGAQGRPVSEALCGKRMLIIHGGGESRRIPAYAVCGKIFCPIPGEPLSALPLTLFDAQIDTYLRLPQNPMGQVIVFAGDVLLRFDPGQVDFSRRGLTGVAARESPQEASGHGVYAKIAADGTVERFVQKPAVEEMQQSGALDRRGRAAIDLGIMSFTPDFAETLVALAGRLTRAEEATSDEQGPPVPQLDFYTEIACCLGSQTTFEEYEEQVRKHGSPRLSADQLKETWDVLHGQPFYCRAVEGCDFLHFGTSEDYLTSGERLSYESRTYPTQGHRRPVLVGCELDRGLVSGSESVIEGCSGSGQVELGGANLIVGAQIEQRLKLRGGVCLDVLPGRTEDGEECFFYRLYGIRDTFKDALADGRCTFLNEPMSAWLERHGVSPDEVWPGVRPEERSLWNARLFPASTERNSPGLVLWMQEAEAWEEGKRGWMESRRWSMEEMARLADGERFWQIREDIRQEEIQGGLPGSLDEPHPLTAQDVAYMIEARADKACALRQLTEACADIEQPFERARLLHTIGSALERLDRCEAGALAGATVHVAAERSVPLSEPGELRAAAFELVREGMLASAEHVSELPAKAIASDQIVWGRAPVRLDLGGGWTDTPPYSLEHGGTVVNAAVDLNGQPPVQVFARVSQELHVRLSSIDLGLSRTITDLEGLFDYQSPEGAFSIAKAALALCGFSPDLQGWPQGVTLREMLERFGGGIELTTLCAVPKGSGLGTSSVVGAVLLATINRMLGVAASQRQLFHQVLVLEQMLTTGGGWQDQIGGAVGGLKLISTRPGMVPDPLVHWLPADSLCPSRNEGATLLYYTGITRLAKNILQHVVGRYLDRDREALRVLGHLKDECLEVRDALERRDRDELGAAVGRVWQLNKKLDPGSSNEEIEKLMERVRPYSTGAKLLGAGGGGFLLIICHDPRAAARCKAELESKPPNELARFFDFQVNEGGLEVTVS